MPVRCAQHAAVDRGQRLGKLGAEIARQQTVRELVSVIDAFPLIWHSVPLVWHSFELFEQITKGRSTSRNRERLEAENRKLRTAVLEVRLQIQALCGEHSQVY
jgi:hypothetical protein